MAKTHPQCAHLGSVRPVTPSGDGCRECLAMGDWSWCFIDEIQVFPA
jgi:hypothetical protein